MCNVLNEDTMTCDYGVSKVLSKDSSIQIMHSEQQQSVHRQQQQQNARKVGVMGSRRIFPPSFKLKVLHSYRNDMDCRGNQRATARKYGIHRRQIQKWLQCEESLKNCAENGNTRPASTSTTDSSASVSKSDSATETTGPAGPAAAAIPVAPALNLNVARLHGDELTTQQKSPPPASPPHLPRCSTSPSTRLRTVPKSVFLQSVGPVRYSQYSSPSDRKHLYRKAEDTVHKQEIYYVDTKMDRNRDHGDETTHVETTQLVLSGDRNEIVSHEDVRMYYWPSSTEHQYIVNDIDVSAHPQCQHQEHHHSPNHCPQNYGNVDLFNGHLYDLIGAPLIKTEPASPDSMATSGPYEPAGSPDDQWAPQSPTVSHQVANNSSGSSSSAHFNSVAGPSYVDVHVHERPHTHTFSSTPYPLSRLHQQERESEEMTSYTKEEGEQKKMLEHYKKVIKEEKEELFDVEVYDERQEDNKSPYIDVTGYTSMDSSSLGNAPAIAPEIELIDLEDQSPSSSDPANSGGSSSTSSDSEIEFIDCVVDNQTSSDSIQTHRQQLRRSFPLRFKLSVLDAFHNDPDVAGNQRATARKFAINRRQVQKWLLKETELREEITLRGDSRQRLAPAREVFVESPIDLTVSQSASSDHSRPSSGTGLETEYEQSPQHCCETLTSQHRPYCPYIEVLTSTEATIESVQLSWILPCYAHRHTTTSRTSSCQDLSLRGSHNESPNGLHCYSPKDYSEFYNNPEEPPPSSKRQASSWDNAPSPKRFCPDDTASRNTPTQQDRPLCLVKPKRAWLMASRMEALARSTRSELDASQPASTSATDDGILYKPYLDNPVCRPTSNYAYQRDPSPNTRQNIINNNNSRNTNGGVDENDIIHSPYTCSTNQDRPYFNPRMPCTWGLPLHPCAHATCNFQQTSDTFIRYPFTNYQNPIMPSNSGLCNSRLQFPYEARTTRGHGLANAVIDHNNPHGFVISGQPHHLTVDQEELFHDYVKSLCS